MKNDTTIKVPAKYADMIASIHQEENGYWVYTAPGYFSPMMGTGTVHESTQKDTLAEIRNLTACADEGECYCGRGCLASDDGGTTDNEKKQAKAKAVSPAKRAAMTKKIKALLAKAEGTDYGPERDAFLNKAEELMLAYAIAEAEARGADGDGTDPRDYVVQEQSFTVAESGSPIQQSLKDLLQHVAMNNRVKVAFYRSPRVADAERAYMVGTESDIDFVKMLFSSLHLQLVSDMEPKPDPTKTEGQNIVMLRHAGLKWVRIEEILGLGSWGGPNGYAAECEEQGIEPRKNLSVKKVKRNFAEGFVREVGKRMAATRKAAEAQHDTTALVPVANAVEQVFAENTTKGRGRKRPDYGYDAAAQARGKAAGAKADLGGKKVKGGKAALKG